jgi:hypothetical protein
LAGDKEQGAGSDRSGIGTRRLGRGRELDTEFFEFFIYGHWGLSSGWEDTKNGKVKEAIGRARI